MINSYIITSNNFNFLTEEKETKEITYRLRIWNEPITTSSSISISGGTYEYTVNVDTYETTPEYCFETSGSTITGYNCYEGNSKGYETITDVIIPSTINGVTMTAINSTKVAYNDENDSINDNTSNITKLSVKKFLPEVAGKLSIFKNLTSITIPDTVTYIGEYSFYMNELSSLTLSKNLTYIGAYAFYDNELTSVKIPDSVTIIGESAFYSNKLTNVIISNSVTTIESNVFRTNQLTSVTIPDSVTTIGANAFYNNKLTSVTIPDSVTTIKTYAFYSNKLTSVKIKGKSSKSDFTSYGSNIWGWATGYSDSNIIWNYTE